MPMETNYIKHYGILGQKWGIRRFQNPDGSLTPEGRKRYLNSDGSLNSLGKRQYGTRFNLDNDKPIDFSKMSPDELNRLVTQMQAEDRFFQEIAKSITVDKNSGGDKSQYSYMSDSEFKAFVDRVSEETRLDKSRRDNSYDAKFKAADATNKTATALRSIGLAAITGVSLVIAAKKLKDKKEGE